MIVQPEPAHRHAPIRPVVWDWLAGFVAVALSVWVLARSGGGAGFRPAGPAAFVLTGLGAACLVWGRSQALPAVLVSSTAATALAFMDVHIDALPFVLTLLLLTAGCYLERRRSVLALIAVGVGLLVTASTRPADLGAGALVQTTLIFVVAWAIGRLTRGWRLALLGQVAAAREQAAAERALADAERDRATLVRVEERLRIARELHDVLAHSISVISVQATVGEHLAGSEPAAAKQSLATIGEVARSSMQELRQLVTLLRDDSEPDSPSASYEPAHGLDDLDELVSTFAAAGLAVSRCTTGAAQELPATAQLCAYRIVQEALTNTLKHAGPGSARLELTYGTDALQVDVTDEGATEPVVREAHTGGHGLIGMRERTLLLGGEFSAGPDPAGGFAVHASIPYQAA